jgi:hypothetical protein
VTLPAEPAARRAGRAQAAPSHLAAIFCAVTGSGRLRSRSQTGSQPGEQFVVAAYSLGLAAANTSSPGTHPDASVQPCWCLRIRKVQIVQLQMSDNMGVRFTPASRPDAAEIPPLAGSRRQGWLGWRACRGCSPPSINSSRRPVDTATVFGGYLAAVAIAVTLLMAISTRWQKGHQQARQGGARQNRLRGLDRLACLSLRGSQLGHETDLGFCADRSYSLMRPPRMGRRLIRCWEASATELGRPPRAELTATIAGAVRCSAPRTRSGPAAGVVRRNQHPVCDLRPGGEYEPFGIGIRSGLPDGIFTASIRASASAASKDGAGRRRPGSGRWWIAGRCRWRRGCGC